MKHLIIALAFLFSSGMLFSQNATKAKDGNYIALRSVDSARNTGKTFTDRNGNVYPVYESIHGKLFYNRTSKAGNVYKAYLKVN